MLAAILLAGVGGRFGPVALVVAGVVALSVTVTNWMAALAAALLREGAFRTTVIGAVSFAIVAALSVVQDAIYPNTGKFLRVGSETAYMHARPDARLIEAPGAFLLEGIVLFGTTELVDGERPTIMIEDQAGSISIVGLAASAGWALLLIVGAVVTWTLVRRRSEAPDGRLLATVVLVVLGQFVLHILYGDGFFLYSLHFVPLLMVVAAVAARASFRPAVLAIAVAVTVLGGWHNLRRLEEIRLIAAEATARRDERLMTERERVERAIASRQHDPWPRGSGHVPIGLPGSPEIDKGYLEPGGSFSPAVGSFGVSFWVSAEDQVFTSDNLPLEDVRQEWIGLDNAPGAGVGVRTHTPYYVAEWRQPQRGEWRLAVEPVPGAHVLQIAIRSVGPAGGPLLSMAVADDGLWLNDRWRIGVYGGIELVDLGPEGTEGWKTRTTGGASASCQPDGWCAARFLVSADGGLHITDTDAGPGLPTRLAGLPLTPGVVVDVPDTRFVASLQSQVAQMLMGTVGEETRPGDPVNYPLAWLRDGAFTLVSLVRAGRLDAAEVLVDQFASRDFFGGFGAEADGPGLALWAIGTVSRATTDPAFDRRMWPHVFRKAQLIRTMQTTRRTMTVGFDGPIVPEYKGWDVWLLADPPADGLISGRMDWHRPRVFVSAVSVRGLDEAVRIARRLGEEEVADDWESWRAALAQAVRTAYESGLELDNTRSLAVALDPTGLARGVPRFGEALDANWGATRTVDGAFQTPPLWTYFELAKARQWLHLGRPERARTTVEWFWNHAPSPGLYTLWEGEGEENSLERWPHVRGWVRPPHVTPHYWAAAEMLMTQLSMLAFADDSTLVVGAGVPESWLAVPLRAQGMVTDLGPVSWHWDGQRLSVDFCGDPASVRPAGAFGQVPWSVRRTGCARP